MGSWEDQEYRGQSEATPSVAGDIRDMAGVPVTESMQLELACQVTDCSTGIAWAIYREVVPTTLLSSAFKAGSHN